MEKPPTAKQLDDACRRGYFCYTGNRQGIEGAVHEGHNMLPVKNHAWVNRSSGVWELIDLSTVIITSELMKEATMPENNVRSISHKRTGKRAHGRPGLPSRKNDAQATGNGKATEEEVETPPATEGGKKKWKPKSTVSLAKQDDLPGVKTHERRDEAIETLAEKFEEAKLAKAAADKDFKEHDELLVALMRRKKREFYSRSTWGEVSVPSPVVHAKFKRPKKDKPSKKK